MQIPLWGLRAWQLPQIGELALSFDVELDVVELPDEAPRLALQVAPRRPRRPGQRLQILFRGTHTPVGEVLFDGQRLKLWHLSEPVAPHDPAHETAHA